MGRGHIPTPLEAGRPENLQRNRHRNQRQAPERRLLFSLEAGEARTPLAGAQVRVQAPAFSPGESPIEVARDRSPGMEAIRRKPHLIEQMLIEAGFLLDFRVVVAAAA
jgi:hypothetical protein